MFVGASIPIPTFTASAAIPPNTKLLLVATFELFPIAVELLIGLPFVGLALLPINVFPEPLNPPIPPATDPTAVLLLPV
ncbi:hypothetical protein D3C85_1457180 [compost metagenome]